MSGDDRFGDLGPGSGEHGGDKPEPEGKSAAERFAELDERDLAEEAEKRKKDEPPRPSGRYSWVVGVVFFIVIVIGMVRVLSNESVDPGLDAGDTLPDFAAPLAIGGLDGDVNLKGEDKDSDQDGPKAACQVRGPNVLNICELRRKPVLLTFMFTRAANCEPQLDRIERVRREFPGVNFAAVVVKEGRGDAQKIARKGKWTYPVAYDRDGQLSVVYDVRGCPTTVFAYAGGKVRKTANGNLSEAELRKELRALEKGPAQPAATTTRSAPPR